MDTEYIEQLAREAQHSKEAIGKLYDYFFSKIFAYASWRVGSRADAEDITSAIFMKMVKNITSYHQKSHSSFQAWLYRIAQTTVIDYYRTHKFTIALERVSDMIFTKDDLAHALDTKTLFIEILNALETLSTRQAEIIRLKFIAELSNKEIAETLGIHEKSVSAASAKGIASLRKKLKL